jgi:hypothetical protein
MFNQSAHENTPAAVMDSFRRPFIFRVPVTGILTLFRRRFCVYSISGIEAFGLLEESTKNHGIS